MLDCDRDAEGPTQLRISALGLRLDSASRFDQAKGSLYMLQQGKTYLCVQSSVTIAVLRPVDTQQSGLSQTLAHAFQIASIGFSIRYCKI